MSRKRMREELRAQMQSLREAGNDNIQLSEAEPQSVSEPQQAVTQKSGGRGSSRDVTEKPNLFSQASNFITNTNALGTFYRLAKIGMEQLEKNEKTEGLSWIGRNTVNEANRGIIAIPQATATDAALQAKKGEEANNPVELMNNTTNAIMAMIPGAGGMAARAQNSGKELLQKKEKQKEKQTAGQIITDVVSGAFEEMPFKKVTNAFIQDMAYIMKNRKGQEDNSSNFGFAEDYGAEESGNIDINHRKVKQNNDGSISTEKSIIIGVDEDGVEKYYAIPTIVDGKEVSPEEAEKHFYETGEHLGKFNDLEKAEKYTQDLSSRQSDFYKNEASNLSNALLKANDIIDKPLDEKAEELAEEGQNYSGTTQFVGNAMGSVGRMAPSIAASIATGSPTAALATMGASVKGSSTNEMLDRGVELEDAVKRGNTDAAIEIGTEMLTGGVNMFGRGTLDDISEKVVKSVKNEIGRFFVQQGIDIAGETLEEVISDVLTYIIDKGTIEPDKKVDFWSGLNKLKETAASTALTTVALKILTGGLVGDVKAGKTRSELRKEVNNLDYAETQKARLNEKIQNDEIASAKELGIEAGRIDSIAKIIDNTNLSELEKGQLKEYAEEYNSTPAQIKEYADYLQEQENTRQQEYKETRKGNDAQFNNIFGEELKKVEKRERNEKRKERIRQVEEEARQSKIEEDRLKEEKRQARKQAKTEKQRLLESKIEKQQVLDNILNEQQKSEEKQPTTIKNKPSSENIQQTTQVEPKNVQTANTKQIQPNNQKTETKTQAKQLPKAVNAKSTQETSQNEEMRKIIEEEKAYRKRLLEQKEAEKAAKEAKESENKKFKEEHPEEYLGKLEHDYVLKFDEDASNKSNKQKQIEAEIIEMRDKLGKSQKDRIGANAKITNSENVPKVATKKLPTAQKVKQEELEARKQEKYEEAEKPAENVKGDSAELNKTWEREKRKQNIKEKSADEKYKLSSDEYAEARKIVFDSNNPKLQHLSEEDRTNLLTYIARHREDLGLGKKVISDTTDYTIKDTVKNPQESKKMLEHFSSRLNSLLKTKKGVNELLAEAPLPKGEYDKVAELVFDTSDDAIFKDYGIRQREQALNYAKIFHITANQLKSMKPETLNYIAASKAAARAMALEVKQTPKDPIAALLDKNALETLKGKAVEKQGMAAWNKNIKKQTTEAIEDRFKEERKEDISHRMVTPEDLKRIDKALSKRIDIDPEKKYDTYQYNSKAYRGLTPTKDGKTAVTLGGSDERFFELKPRVGKITNEETGEAKIVRYYNPTEYADYIMDTLGDTTEEEMSRQRRYKAQDDQIENKKKQDETGKGYDGDNVSDSFRNKKYTKEEWAEEVNTRLEEGKNKKTVKKFMDRIIDKPRVKERFDDFVQDSKEYLTSLKNGGEIDSIINIFNSREKAKINKVLDRLNPINKKIYKPAYNNEFRDFVLGLDAQSLGERFTEEEFDGLIKMSNGDFSKRSSIDDDILYDVVDEFNKKRQEDYVRNKEIREEYNKYELDKQKHIEDLLDEQQEKEKRNKEIREKTRKVEEAQKGLPKAKAEEDLHKTLLESAKEQQNTEETQPQNEEPKQTEQSKPNDKTKLLNSILEEQRNKTSEEPQGTPVLQEEPDNITAEETEPSITEDFTDELEFDVDTIDDYNREPIKETPKTNTESGYAPEVEELAKRLDISPEVLSKADDYYVYDQETRTHNDKVQREYEREYKRLSRNGASPKELTRFINSMHKTSKNGNTYLKNKKYLSKAEIKEKGLDYGNQIVDALASDDIKAKQKTLDNIGKFGVLTYETFKDNYDSIKRKEVKDVIRILDSEQHLDPVREDTMKAEYNNYLNEKLRKQLYEGLEIDYDKPTRYDSDKIRTAETRAATSRKWQKIRSELIKNMGSIQNVLTYTPTRKRSRFEKINKIKDSAELISYYRTTATRVNEMALGFETGEAINNEIFKPLQDHLTERQRFVNDTQSKILNLGIKAGSAESTAIFKLFEGTNGYNESKVIQEFGKEKGKQIIDAKNTIQEIYDDLFYDINDILTSYGFSPIKYRKDYVTHLQKDSKILSTLEKAIENKQDAYDIDQHVFDIAKEEEDRQRTHSGFEKKRTGAESETDAIAAVFKYVDNVASIKYITEDIQRLRAYEQMLRQYSGMEDITSENDLTRLSEDNLSTIEKSHLKKLREEKTLAQYINWLNQYTNVLTGQELNLDNNPIKPAIEMLNKINERIGRNLIGFNLKTPATNLISGVLGISKSSKPAVLKAVGQMLNNLVTRTNDGQMEQSKVYVRRRGNTNTLYDKGLKGAEQRVVNASMKPMGFTDSMMTELIIRSKYNEGLSRFKSQFTKNGVLDNAGLQAKAMEYADDFASRILGERSTGTMPLLFESKTLKPFTQFQLEVNNQLDVFMHDLFRDRYANKTNYGDSELQADAKLVSQAVQLAVLQHWFNDAYEAVLGGRPAFDIIQVIEAALGRDDDDDDDDTTIDNMLQAGGQFASMLPFYNAFSPNARIPMMNILSNTISNAKGLGSGIIKGDEKKIKKGALGLASDAAFNLLLPTGGAQIKRTGQAALTYKDGGNYNASGQLRYPVQEEDKKPLNQVQALLFGRSNMSAYKDYEKRMYRPLSEEQTAEYNELSDVSFKDYLKILDASKKEKEEEGTNKTDTIDKINEVSKNPKDKWVLFKGYVLSDSQKEKAQKWVDSGLTDEENFIKNFDYMLENDFNLPKQEIVDKIIENGVSLDSYVKYEKDIDNMKNEQEQLSLMYSLLKGKDMNLKEPDEDAKATILMNEKYDTQEREALYKSFVGGTDNNRKYKNFKDMGTGESDEINSWLNFIMEDTTNTKIQGEYDNQNKTAGDKQDKIMNFFANHPEINATQRAYIKIMNGFKSISREERDLINEYVKTLDVEDYNDFFGDVGNGFVGIRYSDDGGRDYVEWKNKKIK